MSKTEMMEEGMTRITEAAKYLGLSRTKVYQLMHAGELVYAKFGKSRRIPRRALVAYVQKNLVGSVA
jgi:excisionase family DNA binding protein